MAEFGKAFHELNELNRYMVKWGNEESREAGQEEGRSGRKVPGASRGGDDGEMAQTLTALFRKWSDHSP